MDAGGGAGGGPGSRHPVDVDLVVGAPAELAVADRDAGLVVEDAQGGAVDGHSGWDAAQVELHGLPEGVVGADTDEHAAAAVHEARTGTTFGHEGGLEAVRLRGDVGATEDGQAPPP